MKNFENHHNLSLTAVSKFLNALIVVYGSPQQSNGGRYDIIVFGGTASCLIAAIAAARECLKVAVPESKLRIGGMVTGGLSATDLGRRSFIGGYPLKVFKRVGRYYNKISIISDSVGWFPEPHLAQLVFNEMLKQVGVERGLS